MLVNELLFVCTANVCRSPLAAATAASLLPDSASVLVTSAGTRAALGGALCSSAAGELSRHGVHDAVHSPRQLDADRIRSAALILTAETSHRGQVIRLDPTARSKTFTVLEAIALGRGMEQRPARTGEDRASAIGPDLPTVAALLNSARGRLAPPPPEPRRLFARPRSAADIADGHQESRRAHARTMHLVTDSVRELVSVIEALA